jgi:hypothetical protein
MPLAGTFLSRFTSQSSCTNMADVRNYKKKIDLPLASWNLILRSKYSGVCYNERCYNEQCDVCVCMVCVCVCVCVCVWCVCLCVWCVSDMCVCVCVVNLGINIMPLVGTFLYWFTSQSTCTNMEELRNYKNRFTTSFLEFNFEKLVQWGMLQRTILQRTVFINKIRILQRTQMLQRTRRNTIGRRSTRVRMAFRAFPLWLERQSSSLLSFVRFSYQFSSVICLFVQCIKVK